MSCGIGRRCSSDPSLLRLWCRLATALIGPLPWEAPYAAGVALKRQKKKKKKKKETNKLCTCSDSQSWLYGRQSYLGAIKKKKKSYAQPHLWKFIPLVLASALLLFPEDSNMNEGLKNTD